MSRTTRRLNTKSLWRRGQSKQYGVRAVENFREKSNTSKQEQK